MDDNLLLYRGPERATATLRELKELGVDRVRVTLHWHHFAPDATKTRRPIGELYYGPGVFDNHDHLLREARERERIRRAGKAGIASTRGKRIAVHQRRDLCNYIVLN